MKKTILSLLLLLTAVGSWAQKVWNKPSFEPNPYSSHINITDVEFKPKETILHLNFRFPHKLWVKFVSASILKTPDGKTYAITGGKATREGEDDYTPDSLYYTSAITDEGNLALHFEPLPAKTKTFDFIEGYEQGAFGLSDITDPAIIPTSSNWRSTTTGDWVLGLYKDVAVYDSKVWQYAQKTEKKVVLTDGKENITIAIGKDKNGEREFTINGKKQHLAMITTQSYPDYPAFDPTPLSAELKSGTAHISGIMKGGSSEELKGDTISIMASVTNNFGREYLNYYGKVDSLGYFSLDVPLLGTQELLISPMAGEKRYMYNRCILQPGDSIFMLKEKFYIPMFMGKSARLQNEINSFDRNATPVIINRIKDRNPSREEVISFKNGCLENYNKHLDVRRAFLEQHPTFSQQFRDYDSIKNVFYTAESIISTSLYRTPTKAVPAECAESVMKLVDINASLPLNLITEIRSTIECINRNKVFQGPMKEYFLNTPSALHDLLISGIAKLSVEDSTKIVQFINDPKSVSKTEVERIFEDYGMMGIEAQIRFYHIYDEPFYESICTTDNLLDLHLSNQVSMQLEGSHQPLDEYSLSMANKIKLNSVRERLLKRHEYYKDVLKGKEEAVNAVIHPSTDVEGLTDGKAILDKLVEPYKGKIVYLDIWGTWCGPCKNKLKESHKLKAELKNYDIIYLYLANNSPEDSWKNVIGEYNLTEPNCVHYNLPPKQQRAIEQYVEITGYPTYRLIDRKGGLHHLKLTDDEDLPKFKKTLDELP